jgi:hypothetical protein
MLDWLRDVLGPGPRAREVCIRVAQRLDDSLRIEDRPPLDVTDIRGAPREFRTREKAAGAPLTAAETIEMMDALFRVGRE